MSIFRRFNNVPAEIAKLRAEVVELRAASLLLLQHQRALIADLIAVATSLPDGYMLTLDNGQSQSKEEWLLEAGDALAGVDAHIAALEALNP